MKKLLTFLLVFGFAISTYAEKIEIRKFSGLSTRLNPYELQDNESPDMENFTLDLAGSLTERELFKHYNSTFLGNQPVTDIYKFYKANDSGYLLCVSYGIPYKASANVLTSVMVTTATVTSTNAVWSFETFTDGTNELVYAASQDMQLMKWNGSDSYFVELEDNTGSAEKCNILKKHKSRLFASGDSTYPYRIYYSSLSNGSDFNTTGGTIDLPSYERIINLEILSDILYIFTRTGIYALGGDTPDEFYIIPTRSTVGSHAKKSVALGNRVIFFLNKSGVFAFDGSESVNISETIQPTIDAISSTYLDKAAGLYDKKGKYWLAYTSQTGSFNDTILIYDTVIKQWYKLKGNFASFFKTEGGSDKGEIYAGASDNTGWLWQLQSETAAEQITHSTKTQLQTGVTFNTAFAGTETSPIVKLSERDYALDSNTKLMLHFDEASDSTSTNDSSDSSHAFGFGGDAKISSVRKVGVGSLYLDGTNDCITSVDSPDWNVVSSISESWTIDFWVKLATVSPIAGQGLVSQYQTNGTDWRFWIVGTTGKIYFQAFEGLSEVIGLNGGFLNDTNWHHLAMCKIGQEYGIYLDGIQTAYTSDASTYDYTGYLNIGRYFDNAGTTYFLNGNIDTVRISNKNIFNAVPVAGFTDIIWVPKRYYSSGGTLTSDNLQINASGQSTLGTISWNDNNPSNTDIQFTTRTGATDCTVISDYKTWEGWVSSSSVSMDTVTGATSWTSMNTDGANILEVNPNTTAQPREVLYHEDEIDVNPDCLKFTIGISAFKILQTKGNVSAATTIPEVDISGKKFIGYWIKSPVTGDTIRLSIGEVSGNIVASTTANTVIIDDWEKHWWSIDGYSDTDLNEIKFILLEYIGEAKDTAINFYYDEMWAYDFLDTETITSTPNDWIQYQAIMGSNILTTTPSLISLNNSIITLTYTAQGATTESEMTSTWKSKPFDLQDEHNKIWSWAELDLEQKGEVTFSTVSLGYDLDDGIRTGCLEKTFDVTGSRVKMMFYFPSGVYGKSCQLTVSDNTIDNNLQIHNLTLNAIKTGGID